MGQMPLPDWLRYELSVLYYYHECDDTFNSLQRLKKHERAGNKY